MIKYYEEPCEGRLSRTVQLERGGAIPRRDSIFSQPTPKNDVPYLYCQVYPDIFAMKNNYISTQIEILTTMPPKPNQLKNKQTNSCQN